MPNTQTTPPLVVRLTREEKEFIRARAKKNRRSMGEELAFLAFSACEPAPVEPISVPLTKESYAKLEAAAAKSGRTIAEEFALRAKGNAEEAFAAACEASPDLSFFRKD